MLLKKAKGFYVTATDTGAGKTTVTRSLITALQKRGLTALGCKPVACGVDKYGVNEDVRVYQESNSIPLSNHEINPVCFNLPASPNIAATKSHEYIKVENLSMQLKFLLNLPVDFVFYEGIGGWKVPLNDQETMVDVARSLNVPILLVVGLRVGCLNHALLTWDAISRDNLKVAGWLGNIIDPTIPAVEDHISTLQRWISAPYLGTLPYQESSDLQSFINIDLFIDRCHSNSN